MSSPILTKEIATFLNGVRAEFTEVIDQSKESASRHDVVQLFGASTDLAPIVQRVGWDNKQKGEFIMVTGVLGYLEATGESEPFKETEYLVGPITEVQPTTFTKRIRVSRQAFERRSPSYRAALDEASKLMTAANRTASLHIFDVFNHLRTEPPSLPAHLFVYNDGKKAASTQHTRADGGTYSNVLSSSPNLTVEALDSAILQGNNMKDDTGKPMPYFAGGQIYLVVNPALRRKAREILETENTPYTANYVANIFRGTYNVIVSPLITSTSAWTLVDASGSAPIRHVVFRDIDSEEWFDQNTKTFVFDVSAEWRAGLIDPRAIIHSVGDGTTITD